MLLGHVYPDGDSTGSALGLATALKAAGRNAAVCVRQPVPEPLAALPGARDIQNFAGVEHSGWDLTVLLDCATPERTGLSLEELRKLAPTLVNLDHHATNDGWGDIAWVDPDAAATAEVVVRLIDALSLPLLPLSASWLFVALVADSRGFRSSATRPDTLRLAARLMEAGADGPGLARAVLSNRTPQSLRLLARGLQKIEFDPDLPVIWGALDPDDYAAAGARAEDGEELVDLLQGVQGYPLVVFLRPGESGEWRVGLRSPGVIDVAAVAGQLGGGGHRGGAGATVMGTRDKAMRQVRAAIIATSTGVDHR